MSRHLRFRRLVLKLSGEALGPRSGRGVDMKRVRRIAREMQSVRDAGAELVVVVGGGNLVRGRDFEGSGVDPSAADSMGMMATVINGVAVRCALEELGVDARLQSAIPVRGAAEAYDRLESLRHLAQGRVLICAGGTGNPHFTTDTGAALRARDLGAAAVLKATNVDGVYRSDPRKVKTARRFKRLSYREVIRRELKVMDLTAVALCREGGIPVLVFDLDVPGNVLRAACGEDIGTWIGED